MLKYGIILISIVEMGLIIICGKKFLNIRNKNVENNEVLLPVWVLGIGSIAGVLFCTLALLGMFRYQRNDLAIVLMAVGMAISLPLLLSWVNWRIIYDNDGFVYRNHFRFKRKYSYVDISGINGRKDVRLHIGAKKIYINEKCLGRYEFIETAQKQYGQKHSGFPIPSAERYKSDIFNGHVNNPHEYVIGYAIVSILIVGTIVFSGILVKSQMVNGKIKRFETTFSAHDVNKNELRLYSAAYKGYFEVKSYEKYAQNINFLMSSCNDNNNFMIDAKRRKRTSGEWYYEVINMQDEHGNVYVTYDQTNKQMEDRMRGLYIVYAVVLTIWILIGVGAVILSRKPDKCPSYMLKVFFRAGDVEVIQEE